MFMTSNYRSLLFNYLHGHNAILFIDTPTMLDTSKLIH